MLKLSHITQPLISMTFLAALYFWKLHSSVILVVKINQQILTRLGQAGGGGDDREKQTYGACNGMFLTSLGNQS